MLVTGVRDGEPVQYECPKTQKKVGPAVVEIAARDRGRQFPFVGEAKGGKRRARFTCSVVE
jgi:hypothetical protein